MEHCLEPNLSSHEEKILRQIGIGTNSWDLQTFEKGIKRLENHGTRIDPIYSSKIKRKLNLFYEASQLSEYRANQLYERGREKCPHYMDEHGAKEALMLYLEDSDFTTREEFFFKRGWIHSAKGITQDT